MAEVPGAAYTPFPTAVPTERPVPLETPNVPGAAFGENIARAVESFGGDLKTAGDELFNRAVAMQHLRNETMARDRVMQLDQAVAQRQADFDNLHEQAAHDALIPHIQGINEMRMSMRDGLNPEAQRMFDADAASIQNTVVRTSISKAAAETRAWHVGVGKARIKQIQESPVDLNDPKGLDEQAQKIREITEQVETMNNRDPEEIKEQQAENVSPRLANYGRELARRSPWKADDWVESHKADFRNDDYYRTKDFVLQQQHTVGAKQISQVANSGGNSVAGVPGEFVNEIKTLEGFTPKSKWDVKQWSIGYGTKGAPGEVITRTEADRRFDTELSNAASVVDGVNPNLTEGTRAALVSLTYNTGEAWTKGKLGELIRDGKEDEAKALFMQYNRVAGQPNSVIAARRAQEASWFGKTEMSEIPESRRVQIGVELARRLNPNDPLLEQVVEAQIKKDYASIKAKEFDDQFQNNQVVASGMLGGASGKLPTSVQELTADSTTAEAWSHLRPSQRLAYMREMGHNARGDYGWTEEGLRRYSILKGMANEDDPSKFLKTDMPLEKLPATARKELINLQQKIKANPTHDPALQSTYGELRSLYPDMVPDQANKDDSLQYKGMLLDALNEYAHEFHHPPHGDDLKKIGQTLNSKLQVDGWFGKKEVPVWQLEPGREVMDQGHAQGLDDDVIIERFRNAALQKIFTSQFAKEASGGE